MPEDALVLALLYTMLYGWALVWPIARWGLGLKAPRYAVLAWIFGVSVALSAVAHGYVWYLFHSGNRDAWMAWALPQLIAAAAWVATVIASIVLWSGHNESAT
ncbi:hypothetical protein DSM104440_00282 [Usitatibacter palustris]|uniref:Uncharacterized protein n=1 Tax=Usitatibacter palustris TaxID=2732487 RepID=A0A6M4H340_9PROT|nr:hypothetical protein DSM104440_00282 [Usitatibacter palustris]